MNFSKKKEYEVSDKSLICNPQSIVDFMYGFGKKFEYEITSVDASSEDRIFNFGFLYLKDGIQKNVVIEYSNYDAKLKFDFSTFRVEEIDFNNMFKEEENYIKQFI